MGYELVVHKPIKSWTTIDGDGGQQDAIGFGALREQRKRWGYLCGILIEASASITQTSGSDTITVAEQADMLASISYSDAFGSVCNALSGRQLDNVCEALGILTDAKCPDLKHNATMSGTDAISFSSSWILPFAPGVFTPGNNPAEDLIGAREFSGVKEDATIQIAMIDDDDMDGNFALTSGTYWTVKISPIVAYSDEYLVTHRCEIGTKSVADGSYDVTLPGKGYRSFHAVKVTAQDYSAFAAPTKLSVSVDGNLCENLTPGDTVNRGRGWMGFEAVNQNMDDGQIIVGNLSAMRAARSGVAFQISNAHEADGADAYYHYMFTRAPFADELEADLVQAGIKPAVAQAIRTEYETLTPPNGQRVRLRTAAGAPIGAIPDKRPDLGVQRQLLFADVA
jgi:hypothetical protein